MTKKIKSKITLFLIFLLFCFFLYCFLPIIFFQEKNLPERIFLTDRNSEIITDKANSYWYKIKKEVNLNSKFVKNLLQIEDKNFYNHFWINILSKFRALKDNISSKKIVSGWSTITEQYIKNHYFKTNKRTYLQKSREAILAFSFSIFYKKEDILQKYLQDLYLWNNIYGVYTASKIYFWKEKLADLTDEEITILLTLLKNPSIKSLADKNFQNYFKIVKNRLSFQFENKIKELKKYKNIDKFPFVTNNFWKNIWKTTIDSNLQEFAKKTLNQTLKNLKSKNVTNWAIFAINPKTMEVLIYIWSKDFYDKKIDWQVDIINSLRQVWSTFKPFLYLLALEKWAWVNSMLLDIENEYNSFQKGKVYISENYSLKEYGIISLQKALWNSLNNATVRLAREIWLQEIFDFYKSYGFKFLKNDPNYFGYSFVLGNPSITLKNLVLSYVNLLPDFEIKNRKEQFSIQKNIEKTWKIDKNKFLLYNILKNPDNRDISFWVNSILNTSIPQAVKTGTSSNFRDNLVVSYNPNFVIWIWLWNNDNTPMKWVTGITWTAYIWHQIIEKAISLGYINNKNYEIPTWISEKDYCLDFKCFRKKIDLDKKEKKYYSKILEKYYSKRDLFEKLEVSEIDRLKDLWFELKK